MKVLVLLSGGLDSTVMLASLDKVHKCRAVGFYYGQPHFIELKHAKQIAAHYDVLYDEISLPNIPLIDDCVFASRNVILAGHAMAMAQNLKFEAIALGCNMTDWERFPDCRPVFWTAMERVGEAYGIKVLTPLLHTLKQDIFKWARENQVPIDLTWSCYNPQGIFDPQPGEPCGKCLACTTRAAAA